MSEHPDERRALDDLVAAQRRDLNAAWRELRDCRDRLAVAQDTIKRQREVIAAAEQVANQNSLSASPALQRALSRLDFALDRLTALSGGDK